MIFLCYEKLMQAHIRISTEFLKLFENCYIWMVDIDFLWGVKIQIVHHILN